jgi:hypothetical protein
VVVVNSGGSADADHSDADAAVPKSRIAAPVKVGDEYSNEYASSAAAATPAKSASSKARPPPSEEEDYPDGAPTPRNVASAKGKTVSGSGYSEEDVSPGGIEDGKANDGAKGAVESDDFSSQAPAATPAGSAVSATSTVPADAPGRGDVSILPDVLGIAGSIIDDGGGGGIDGAGVGVGPVVARDAIAVKSGGSAEADYSDAVGPPRPSAKPVKFGAEYSHDYAYSAEAAKPSSAKVKRAPSDGYSEEEYSDAVAPPRPSAKQVKLGAEYSHDYAYSAEAVRSGSAKTVSGGPYSEEDGNSGGSANDHPDAPAKAAAKANEYS